MRITMKDNKIQQILILGVVLLALLVAAKFLFIPATIDARTINAEGTAQMTAQPDEAQIYVRIQVLEQTAELAASKSKEAANNVVNALKKIEGVQVETTNYNFYKREDWTENGREFKGYEATYTIKATTQNLDRVGEIIDTAVDSGANGIDSVQFTLSKEKEEELRAQAIKKAAQTAKMKAQATAEGLGVKLGKIIAVNEGGFYAQPYFYDRAESLIAEAKTQSAPLVIEPGSIHVSASVSVTYEIK
jgi:hypothetical protein